MFIFNAGIDGSTLLTNLCYKLKAKKSLIFSEHIM